MDNFLIGHVRYATVGGISDQNSHPFDIDQVIGVHNGTLMDEKYQHLEKTDSEMMFEDVNTRGLIPVLQELDKDSAYAIVLLSKRTNEISFTRNDKRSLWYAVNTKRNVFYWSTERVMLMFAAAREGIDISTPIPFTPGLVYTFSPLDVQTDRTPNWRIRNIHPVDVDDPGVTPIGDNILRLPAPASNRRIDKEIKKRQKKASKLHQDCTYCDKVMDLYDQYKGVELEDGTYSCAECAEITTQITNHVAKKGLLN
jgi:asparagine synthetase B (glutamine-hydrolysing)